VIVTVFLVAITSAIETKRAKRGILNLGYGSNFGYSLGYKHFAHPALVKTINHAVAVPVPHPVPITIHRQVPVPVPQPYYVPVPRPVAVHVPTPVKVEVPRPYIVHIDRPVPVPVAHPVEVPIPRAVPVPVAQPYAVPQSVFLSPAFVQHPAPLHTEANLPNLKR
jgi:hypothetical protein